MQAAPSSNSTIASIQRGLRTFYALAISQTVSQIGSTMSFLGVGIYIYQKTGEATPLALMSFFLILPRILAGGLAGVLADRYDRRTMIIVGDTGAALGSAALAISVVSGNFQIWHVYVAGLWQALFSTLQTPAFEASVSQLVTENQRQRANAVMQLSKPTSLLLASALTGILYVAIGVVGIFLIDLASFLVAVTTTLVVRIPAPPRSEVGTKASGSMMSEWRSGIGFLWSRRPLFILVMQAALFGFFVSSVFALMTPYVLARTDSAPALGFLNAITSVGGVVGAIGIGAWGGFKRRIDTIMIGMIVLLIGTAAFGAGRSAVVMGAALFIGMMCVTATNVSAMTLLQAKVPGDMQGRVFAIFTQLTLILTPLGYLVIGPLADKVFTPLAGSAGWAQGVMGALFGTGAAGGMGGLFGISAALALVVTLAVYALPTVRRMESTLPTYNSTADASQSSGGAAAEAGLPVSQETA